jgi:uncharacterized protein YeaO (DUF488 family)
MPVINIKRIYEEAEPSDGFRVLVDKLWPRGISKDRAKLDYWAKQLAPTDGMRKWYQHDEGNWEVFQKKYNSELDNNPEALLELMTYLERGDVTFLFSSKELYLNNAVALKAYIISRSK